MTYLLDESNYSSGLFSQLHSLPSSEATCNGSFPSISFWLVFAPCCTKSCTHFSYPISNKVDNLNSLCSFCLFLWSFPFIFRFTTTITCQFSNASISTKMKNLSFELTTYHFLLPNAVQFGPDCPVHSHLHRLRWVNSQDPRVLN